MQRTRICLVSRGEARWRWSRGRHCARSENGRQERRTDRLQAKRLVSLSYALATVEEVGLNVVQNREPRAARGVGHSPAVGTGGTFLNDGSCKTMTVSDFTIDQGSDAYRWQPGE